MGTAVGRGIQGRTIGRRNVNINEELEYLHMYVALFLLYASDRSL